MISIIVSGHAQLSTGILSAFEMIYGKESFITAIPFENGDGIEMLSEKFRSVIETSGEETLIMVDLFGGTPYNAAMRIAYGRNDVDIVTGVNLPLLLEAATMREAKLQDLTLHLKEASKEDFVIFSEAIKHTEMQNDIEEDEL